MASKGKALEIRGERGTLRLVPRGDLVARAVVAQRTELLKALKNVEAAVVLDLSGVAQVDPLGVSLVLGLFTTCQARGMAFRVEGVRANVLEVLGFFGLPQLLSVEGAQGHG